MAMLFLCGLKSDEMKKDLRIAYAQGYTTCYPQAIEEMARMHNVEYKLIRRQ